MMKITKIVFAVAIFSSLMVSCVRDEVVVPTVDVTATREIYKVNEEVRFNFDGSADMITFYSGEKGKEYKHRNRVELEGGDLRINMETQVLYGIQPNNLKLLVSTDFNGKYTKQDVEAAAWTDISDRLTWCVAANGAVGVRTVSDYVSIKDLLEPGKPLFFAFKYVGLASTTGTAQQRTWRVYQFNVQNKFSDTEIIPVTNRVGAAWSSVTMLPSDKGIWVYSNADMIYYNPESNLLDVEKWAISKRFDPNKVAPDQGTAIKKYPDNDLKEYVHKFTAPGEYEVSFVFVNGNYNDVQETVKTVKITVK